MRSSNQHPCFAAAPSLLVTQHAVMCPTLASLRGWLMCPCCLCCIAGALHGLQPLHPTPLLVPCMPVQATERAQAYLVGVRSPPRDAALAATDALLDVLHSTAGKHATITYMHDAWQGAFDSCCCINAHAEVEKACIVMKAQ